jgi:hypothetical protein
MAQRFRQIRDSLGLDSAGEINFCEIATIVHFTWLLGG